MSQQIIQNIQMRQPTQSDNDSLNSIQFQQLSYGENCQVHHKLNQQQPKNIVYTYINQQQKYTSNIVVGLQNKVLLLQKQLKQQQIQLQQQKKIKNNFIVLYESSNAEIKILKEKLNMNIIENSKLKEINIQLKQLIENIKQQGQQYIDKINCLQKKIYLEKQQFQNKFNVIKKNMQIFTKVNVKNVDNQNLMKFFINKFMQMEKIMHKIGEMEEMIVEKNQKNKINTQGLQILQQKYNVLQRIQNILIKQQNRINGLRQHLAKAQQQLLEARKNNKSGSLGFGKFFDPVIKFCKVEEIKEAENKKKRDNM